MEYGTVSNIGLDTLGEHKVTDSYRTPFVHGCNSDYPKDIYAALQQGNSL